QVFADFLVYPKEYIIGKPVADIDKNTRFPFVLKSKKSEIAWKHKFENGKTAIVHRIVVLDEHEEVKYAVGMVLFEDLEIPSKKKSTAESVLTDLIDKHPIIPMILEHRSVSKLLSTYVTGIEKRATEKGRVHTTYNQDVTLTGRLSSEDPN
ncbi:hypothetical protein HKB06_26405, partial [Vibrio parahaemolyticus]|nr:hypothetical protein [Vibrio parahaemolyticus]